MNNVPAPVYSRREIITLHNNLISLKSVTGNKLNYAINRTIASLAPLARHFDISMHVPDTPEFLEYTKGLTAAYSSLSNKRTVFTEKGEMLDFDINSEEAKQIRVDFLTKYETMLADRDQQVQQYNEWLDKPCGESCEHPDTENYLLFHVSAADIADNMDKSVWDACMDLITE